MFFQVFGHKKRGLQKPRFLQTHFLMERKKNVRFGSTDPQTPFSRCFKHGLPCRKCDRGIKPFKAKKHIPPNINKSLS